VPTTFSSYGEVARARQAELIRRLGSPGQPPHVEHAIEEAVRALQEVRQRCLT
jgi:hypothetical protein